MNYFYMHFNVSYLIIKKINNLKQQEWKEIFIVKTICLDMFLNIMLNLKKTPIFNISIWKTKMLILLVILLFSLLRNSCTLVH